MSSCSAEGRLSRRLLLGGGLGGFFGLALRSRCDTAFARRPAGRAKRCLVLWMNGGPSQLDSTPIDTVPARRSKLYGTKAAALEKNFAADCKVLARGS